MWPKEREIGWLTGTWWPLLFSCSHLSPGSCPAPGWSPKVAVVCFFPKVPVFCFFISSQFLCAVLSVSTLPSPAPVMHIFCLRRGEWFVIEAGWGMYCWKRELILALSETVLVLLFHFVSICLCILVGPWVGGWVGMGARCQGRVGLSSEEHTS